MTVRTELNAVTPTANAKSVLAGKAQDTTTLMAMVKQHTDELRVILAQLISLHPSGGGDAANLSALNTILAELV